MTQTSNGKSTGRLAGAAACAALAWGMAGAPLQAQDGAEEVPRLVGIWDGGGGSVR